MRRSRLAAHSRRSSAAVLALCLVLAACTSDDDAGDRNDPENVEEAAAEEVDESLAAGPAPFAITWANDTGVAVRVDEVVRDGDELGIDLTLLTRRELRLDDSSIRILTNSGIELPRAPEQERTLPDRSQAAIELHASGITDELRQLTLDIADVSLSIDVPEDGDTIRWAPAPERQVGLTDVVLRDNSPVVVVPYTFRTEGMISELTFSALAVNTHEPSLCYYRQHTCQLEDGSGRVYPMLRPSHEFGSRERVTGTLRFIGEIPPDQTQLRLRLAGSSGFMTTPDPEFSHEFTLPRAEDSPLRVTGGPAYPEPFDVGETLTSENGLTMTLGEMSFTDDRIQLQVTYELDGDSSSWVLANYRNDSLLRDPTGYEHQLWGPSEDPQMRVEGGDRLETTLVFAAPLAPGTPQLQLVLASGDDPVETTIDIPPGSGGEDGEGAPSDVDDPPTDEGDARTDEDDTEDDTEGDQ